MGNRTNKNHGHLKRLGESTDLEKLPSQCSFCHTEAGKVRRLIAGYGVSICNECVELCNTILREEEND